jgi:hypothetical protein
MIEGEWHGFDAVGSFPDHLEALRLAQDPQDVTDLYVVIDDQDGGRGLAPW